MPQSRVALAESLSDTLASLQTARSGLSNAWALRMSASQKAHFAAVMGNSLTRNCREQGWIVEDALRDDASLVSAMHHYAGESPALYSAIADHIRWILTAIEKGITDDIRTVDPLFERHKAGDRQTVRLVTRGPGPAMGRSDILGPRG